METIGNKTMGCQHTQFRARCSVMDIAGTNHKHVQVEVMCTQCEMPLRFLGVDVGFDPTRPMIPEPSGFRLHAPAIVEGDVSERSEAAPVMVHN